jgi:hypothetical protein
MNNKADLDIEFDLYRIYEMESVLLFMWFGSDLRWYFSTTIIQDKKCISRSKKYLSDLTGYEMDELYEVKYPEKK